jgi:ribosomal protein S8
MDNLANLFSKIQNGQNLHKIFVRVPFSKKSWNICNILFIEGLIKGFFFKENFIYIFLKYAQNEPVIKRIEKLSLQGRRLYTKKGLNGFAKRSVMIDTIDSIGLVRIGYESIRTYPIQTHDSRSTDGLIGLNGLVGLDAKQPIHPNQSIQTNHSIQGSDGLKCREKSRSNMESLDWIGCEATKPNHAVDLLNGLVGLETKDCFANSPIPSISQSIQASLVNKKKNLQFFKLRILSTSKGIMSERDSKFLGIGGEILCDIY